MLLQQLGNPLPGTQSVGEGIEASNGTAVGAPLPQGWPGELTLSMPQIRTGFCHPTGPVYVGRRPSLGLIFLEQLGLSQRFLDRVPEPNGIEAFVRVGLHV